MWYKRGMITRFVLFIFLFSWSLPAWAEPLTLWHTSEVDGLASAYRYQLGQPYLLGSSFFESRADDLRLKSFGIDKTRVYFASENGYLWGDGFGIPQLEVFLKNLPAPLERRRIQLLSSANGIILQAEAGPEMQALFDFVARTPYAEQFNVKEAEWQRYPGGIYGLHLIASETAPLPVDPLQWELILGFDMRFEHKDHSDVHFNLIGQPQGEGSRRLRLIQLQRQPGDLLLDSGNLLEGLSAVMTDRLSLQRQNSLQMSQTLNYTALNIGRNELQGGLDNLLAEQARYQLPLISASLKQDGHYLFSPYRLIEQNGKRLLVIGVADADALKILQLNGTLPQSLTILEPEQALEQALQNWRKSPLNQRSESVQIVLLTHLDTQKIQELKAYNQHLDLILTPTQSPPQSLSESLVLRGNQGPHVFIPQTSPYAVNRLRFTQSESQSRWDSDMFPIFFGLPPERQFLEPILKVRQQAYRDALEILIPNLEAQIRRDPDLLNLFINSRSIQAIARSLGGGYQALSREELLTLYPPYMTAEMFANLEMNGLLESFDAEVVLFKRDYSTEFNVPGALPRLLVYEGLKMPDTLQLYTIDGESLKKLLEIPDANLLFGGVNAAKTQVWGRDIGSHRQIYRVLIPSSIAQMPAVQRQLTQANLIKTRHPFREEHQGAVYLREVLLGVLQNLKQQPPEHTAAYLKPLWHQKRTLFTIHLDKLQFNLSGYNALNNQSYAEVRETRVTSPSSFTFGGISQLGFALDNQGLGWDNRLLAKYEGLSVIDQALAADAKERFSENQDDLVFSTELQLRLFEFPLGETRISLVPFLEGLYDTEFTATLNPETKLNNPLQSELRGVLGLSIPSGPRLKTFKTGLALRRDLNVPNNLEAGFDLKFVHEQPINTSLKWKNDLDFRYFFPTPNDNASSLGLIAQWVSSLDVSLTQNLSLRFYADSYLFQGKLASNREVGASVILGVGLGYERFWKPWFEPLF